MKRFFRFVVLCVVVAMVITTGFAMAAPEKTAPKSSHSMSTAGEAPASALSGKVVETMNSGGYTYVSLENNGKKTWVAVPQTTVTVGQQLTFQPGAEMQNFMSKSLNRTFESIIFSGGIAAGAAAAGGDKPTNMPQHDSKAAASVADKTIKVEKATGPNAYTVAEIFEKRAALHEKPAVVKGKVVKVSSGIMGKNWIHVQDGTGDAKKSTHNLVVTSDDQPAVGDVVLVKGTVFKDKDFGSGYKYNVIIEKASISKQ
jgi:hypothetical protein